MKTLLLLPCIILPLQCFSNGDTLYYSVDNKHLKTKKKAAYGRVIVYNEDSTKVTVDDFYLTGIKMSKKTIRKQGNIKIETVANYYKDGNPKSFYSMLNEKLDGNCLSYDENGKMAKISTYEKGELKQSKYFDNDGKELVNNPDEIIYLTTEIMPEYPGGGVAMMKFISANFEYPTESSKNRSDGRVIVSFIVNEEGDVTQVKIVQSVDFYIDNEAMRVIKRMPKWKPGILYGKPESVKFTVPIALKHNQD